ncbi:hypothetical protein V1477_009359 [Vespula maculifrons]|uniref:Uncharacterized protein n=1 Tax=Vespula maculifrons TaxID=7453 RepID=A0ABD2CA86_VESMC
MIDWLKGRIRSVAFAKRNGNGARCWLLCKIGRDWSSLVGEKRSIPGGFRHRGEGGERGERGGGGGGRSGGVGRWCVLHSSRASGLTTRTA